MNRTILPTFVILLGFLANFVAAETSVLQFTCETKSTVKSEKTKNKPAKTTVDKTSELTTLLADQYAVEDENSIRIHDLPNLLVTIYNHQNSSYVQYNPISVLAYRVMELENRVHMSNMFMGAGMTEMLDAYDLFKLESLFVIELPGQDNEQKRGKLSHKKSGYKLTCKHNGKTICKVTFSKQQIPDELKTIFARYFTYKYEIHPQFQRLIIEDGRFPKQIDYQYDTGFKSAKVIVNFKDFKYLDTNTTLAPADYKPERSKTSTFDANLTAIETGQQLPNRITDQEFEEFAGNAMKNKQYLDAMLALIEQGLQEDNDYQTKASQIIPIAQNDPQFILFSQAMSISNPKQFKYALELLDEIDTTNLKKAYLLDIFRANKMIDPQQSFTAISHFRKALEANPYITGAYVDLGKMYYEQYETQLAWRCWDAARKIKPDHDFLQQIDPLEDMFKAKYPQYFLQNNSTQIHTPAQQ